MPEQKGWAELELETPKPLSDLKQKKRSPGIFHLKWPGIVKTSWLAAPKFPPQRLFGRQLFLGRDSTAQLFCP
jgi:hypothetical protein